MNLTEAESLARSLMRLHGVDSDWGFGWSRSRQKYGETRRTWRRGVFVQEIVLSKPLTEVASPDRMRNTILHEVAHALVGIDQGHNSVWRAKCLEIGGDGLATVASMTDVAKVAKYTYHCPVDDEVCAVSQRRHSTVGWQCRIHGAGLLRKHIIGGERVQDLDYVAEGGVLRP